MRWDAGVPSAFSIVVVERAGRACGVVRCEKLAKLGKCYERKCVVTAEVEGFVRAGAYGRRKFVYFCCRRSLLAHRC